MFRKNNDGQSAVHSVMKISGIIMTITYLVLAVLVFLFGGKYTSMPKEYMGVFASILLMYGLFRGWKTYDTYFKNNDNAL